MKVRMVNSVGEHAAGEEAALDDATSDRFIVLGYAVGKLSRNFSDEEIAELRERNQEVSV